MPSVLGRYEVIAFGMGGANIEDSEFLGSGMAMYRYPISRSIMFEAIGPYTPFDFASRIVGDAEMRP